MWLPVILLFFATLAGAVMAYGTHANWAGYPHGFDFILFARRVQWPMAALALALCMVLVGLVIAGRRRAWWLIGLGPVLALFVHRFGSDSSNQFLVIENPAFETAASATFVGDDDWVVGVRFADADYAYPYAALFETPVVIHADHDRRLALMWSAYANRAVAVQVGRELRAADLEVVSMPANALLLYNSRLGQFVNGLTARTPGDAQPDGFGERVPITKTTWKLWRANHPETQVLMPVGSNYTSAPRVPIRPTFPLPLQLPPGRRPTFARVVMVEASQPIAVQTEEVGTEPLNLAAGDEPVLLFRDRRDGGVRAFERRIDDLRPRFRLNADRRREKVAFVDLDTSAGWDRSGRAVDGPPEFRGRRLAPLPAEDGLYWDVMAYWTPGIKLVSPAGLQP